MTTKQDKSLGYGSIARMRLVLPAADLDKATISGLSGLHVTRLTDSDKVMVTGSRHNAFVNQGLKRALDLLFNATKGSLSGISHIALSGDSAAVTAATTTIGTPNSIKTVTAVARVNQTTHGEATWTQADVAFAIRKIGFLYGPAATDVANIIGGAGGSAPYDEDFTLDLQNIAAWSLQFGIDLTASAS